MLSILSAILTFLFFSLTGTSNSQPTLMRPPPISSGSPIRVIATAGAVDAAGLSRGTALLAGAPYSLEVRQDLQSLLAVDMYYAGTDMLRTRGLLNALDEEVGALWAARGGYGTARILYNVEVQDAIATSLRSKPRWLVGYSDLTALIGLWNKAGVLALHGPMAANIQTFSEAARTATFDILSGTTAVTQQFTGSIRYRGSNGGARGKILGGNISVLASMVGSGLLPSYEGAILFIEDLNEQAYRLDRMLCTILHSPDFRGIVGIAVGQLLGTDPASGGYTALALLDETWGPLGIPVLTGLPIGHDTATAMPLVLGAPAEISFAEGSTIGVLKVEVPEAL